MAVGEACTSVFSACSSQASTTEPVMALDRLQALPESDAGSVSSGNLSRRDQRNYDQRPRARGRHRLVQNGEWKGKLHGQWRRSEEWVCFLSPCDRAGLGFSVSQVAVTVWNRHEFAELLLFFTQNERQKGVPFKFFYNGAKGLCAESR